MFQIHRITNGFLITMPPSAVSAQMAMQNGQQPQPQTVFAENFTAVMLILKSNWPTETTGIEVIETVNK